MQAAIQVGIEMGFAEAKRTSEGGEEAAPDADLWAQEQAALVVAARRQHQSGSIKACGSFAALDNGIDEGVQQLV